MARGARPQRVKQQRFSRGFTATADDPDATYAHAEMTQIAAQVEMERSRPTGMLHIIRTPSLRKRMICTLLVWTMGLSTGSTVLANLTPTLFGSLGYSTVLQLGLSVVWVVCLFLGCFVCVYLLDRVGRVKLLGKSSLSVIYSHSRNADKRYSCRWFD